MSEIGIDTFMKVLESVSFVRVIESGNLYHFFDMQHKELARWHKLKSKFYTTSEMIETLSER